MVACGTDEKTPVLTPEQMYEQAGILLKPHAEREKPDYQGALKLLQESANHGYLPAIIDLAGVYMEGSSDGTVKKDPQKAFHWYRQAAMNQYPGAIRAMGRCYRYGIGTEVDMEMAVQCFEEASQAADGEAMYYLGLHYEKGEGVKKSLAMAAQWYEMGAGVGDANCQCNIGWCYETGTGVKKDMKRAVHWYRESARRGVSHKHIQSFRR
jgi:TPR repeat protein